MELFCPEIVTGKIHPHAGPPSHPAARGRDPLPPRGRGISKTDFFRLPPRWSPDTTPYQLSAGVDDSMKIFLGMSREFAGWMELLRLRPNPSSAVPRVPNPMSRAPANITRT